MAKTPETSKHTSIQQRIQQAQTRSNPNDIHQQLKTLMPFAGNPRQPMPKGLPFRLTDYIELVEWSGKQMRVNKKGYIPHNIPPILEQLNIEPKHWLYLNKNFESKFKNLVGAAHQVKQACQHFGKHWAHGIDQCEEYFSSG